MPLTKGEIVQVAGRLVERIGVALDDPETPGSISKGEVFELLQETIQDALNEYDD